MKTIRGGTHLPIGPKNHLKKENYFILRPYQKSKNLSLVLQNNARVERREILHQKLNGLTNITLAGHKNAFKNAFVHLKAHGL